ncbi:MAG TPA: LamG-like jellyroll fold domain-containing protein, partial [Clostridia bacterium]|nr:LamG-like jellyroll fold domain-containing protein [Clostridia bacterium]
MNRLITIKRQVLACIGTAILGLSAYSASAGWITLTNNDSNGTSSFAEKRNWNDSAAPHAGNDYGVIDARVLRSLPTAGNVTFQGHSLTVSNGGTIFYKSPAGQTITVGNSSETGLFLDGGKFLIIEGGKSYTLAGFMTLGANNGLIDVWNGTGTIASQIGGSGSLVVFANNSSSPGSGTVVLSGANTYSGATVLDVPTTLRLAGAGTLGGGTSTLAISNSASKGFGTVDLNGTSQTIGNLVGGGGRIINNLANTTSTLTVGAANTGGGQFLGSISNAAGILALKKVGTATLTLAGTNRYTGGTIIEDGALQMSGITGPLGGAGKLVLLTPDGMPAQRIEGMDPAFSGQLVVKSGWLIGANGAFGTNSITVDPYYTLDPSADGVFYGSTAVLEPDYDVNSAGTLTLVNGGVFVLHQNCAFSAVTIEGTPLSPGTHPYAELAAMFPYSFSATGAGAITVQPYGTLPVLPPEFVTHPVAVSRYAGYSAQFSASVAGDAVTTYQWYKDGNPLADENNILGATTATLTVVNISSSNVGNYHVVAGNAGGSKPSNAALLTLLTPVETFESTAVGLKPVAYLRLDEAEDPALGNVLAHDHAGGFDGVYGTIVENGARGIAGPRSYDGFSGFSDLNNAARFMGGAQGSRITLPALNLNTNTVTLTAWINPGLPQADAGVIFCRGSGTVAGMQFTGNVDQNGWRTLGYTWNNEGGTWTWNSRIAPPPGIWSMVALVITPTNASIYMYNAYGLKAVNRPYNHVNQAFSAPTLIGEDSHNGNRQFDGLIDEVAIYSQSLSQDQLTSLYGAASGIAEFAPTIISEPEPVTLYEQQTAQFSVQASGTQPLTFQWQRLVNGIFDNVVDDGRISGANTATLTIKNVGLADDTDYQVAIANNMGAVLSMSTHLTVQQVMPAEQITLPVSQGSGQSWDTLNQWSDGLAASHSAVYKPGSTYHILPGAAMRT